MRIHEIKNTNVRKQNGLPPSNLAERVRVRASNGNNIRASNYWRICTYNIQSIRNEKRLRRLNDFLIEHYIDVLAVQETNWDGSNFSNICTSHTWFGTIPTKKQSGVGFFVKTDILNSFKVEVKQVKSSKNIIFLLLRKPNRRTTCLMNVYGKSNPSTQESKEQWASYNTELQAALRDDTKNTDIIFMGDINARVGCAQNNVEENAIGRFGEPNGKRNLGGELSHRVFQ